MWRSSQRSHALHNTIKAFMTSAPRTVDANCHLISAKKLMAECGFRHLPVLDRTKIVGIVSERDIRRIEYVYRKHEISEVRLSDVCLFEPYCVEEDTPLEKALDKMIAEKIGSVIVKRKGRVTGIFTTIDACRVLKEMVAGK